MFVGFVGFITENGKSVVRCKRQQTTDHKHTSYTLPSSSFIFQYSI